MSKSYITKSYPLTIDFLDYSNVRNATVKVIYSEKDINTAFINAKLVSNGDPINLTLYDRVVVGVSKSDGHSILTDCVITDGVKGEIEIPFTRQALTSLGVSYFDVTLYKSNSELVSPKFSYRVAEAAVSNESISSTDEFNTLSIMISQLTTLIQNNEQLTARAEQLTRDNEVLTTKVTKLEETVNTNEGIRNDAENIRESSETTRGSQEGTRVSNENIRIENETARGKSEVTRGVNEVSRVDSENTRVISENVRVASETKRGQDESVRISNEETRISSENTRKTNEAQRIKDENTRKSSEDIRVSSETTRVDSENTRKSNEIGRVSSENIRKSNEVTREGNESTRQGNETARVNNEGSRVNAEDTRVSNENIRESSEVTRKKNETTREGNENTRQTQETSRQQAMADFEIRFNELANANPIGEVTSSRTSIDGTVKANLNERLTYDFNKKSNTGHKHEMSDISGLNINASNVPIQDVDNNFTSKNAEGALKEVMEKAKLNENTISALSIELGVNKTTLLNNINGIREVL